MGKSEKQFQNYFMKIAKLYNFYRTSILNGSGYPDVTAFHGERHSLIELKDLVLGKRGDRKLRGLFEETQPPWYIQYFLQGGKRLFVVWRVTEHDGSGKRYGVWKLTKVDTIQLSRNLLYYKGLINKQYIECSTVKKLIEIIEEM